MVLNVLASYMGNISPGGPGGGQQSFRVTLYLADDPDELKRSLMSHYICGKLKHHMDFWFVVFRLSYVHQ
jgi:hypothetical protein